MATINIDFQVKNADTLQRVARNIATLGENTEDFARANDIASRALKRQIDENAKLEVLQKKLNKAIAAGNINLVEANKIMAQATKEAARRVRQDKQLIDQEKRLEKQRQDRIKALEKEKKQLSDLKAKYNPLYAAERRMAQIREDNLKLQRADIANKAVYAQRIEEAERDLKQFTRAIKENNGALIDSGNQFAKFNTQVFNGRKEAQKFGSSGLQQAGYQIQDFAVQVSSGQNALMAFGQQFSQLISIAGPYGAAAGAIVAVGVAIYRVFEASQDAVKITEQLDKSFQDFEKRVIDLTDAYANLNMTLEERREFSNVPALQQELEIRERLLQVAIARSRFAEDGTPITSPFRGIGDIILGGSGLSGAAEATGTSVAAMADLTRLSTDVFSPGLEGLQEQYAILERVSNEIAENLKIAENLNKIDDPAGLALYQGILERMQLINSEIERARRNDPAAVQGRVERAVGDVEKEARLEALKEDITQLQLAVKLTDDLTQKEKFLEQIAIKRAEIRRAEVEAVREAAREAVMSAVEGERLDSEALRAVRDRAEAAANAAEQLYIQRENTEALVKAAADQADYDKEREESLKRIASGEQVAAGFINAQNDAAVKLLEAQGKQEQSLELQVQLAGDRAAAAVLAKAETEEEAIALQGAAEEARVAAENAIYMANEIANAKEEARLLEAAVAAVGRAMGRLQGIGASIQSQIAVARARIEAIESGANAAIAGRVETQRQRAKTAYEDTVKEAEKLASITGDVSLAEATKAEALETYNQTLSDTVTLQGLLNEEEAKAEARRKAEQAARKSSSGGGRAKGSKVDQATKDKEKLQEYLEGLQAENRFLSENLYVTEEQYEIERKLHELRQQYGPLFTSQIEQQTAALLKQNQQLEEQRRTAERVADTISSAIGNAFYDVVTGAKSAEEAFREMALSIINELFRILVVERLVQSIKGSIMGTGFGAGFANGGVFSGGNVIPFANGGVVGSPTFFPMSGGRTGLMGEAGPEAIMPLKRGRDGKLGVQANDNSAPVVNQKIVNVLDPSVMSEYLSSRDGEKVIMNVIRRNRNG